MTHNAESASTGARETSARAIYRMVCEGDPVAIRNYLQTADPEDANHGILDYIDRLSAVVAVAREATQYRGDETNVVKFYRSVHDRLRNAVEALDARQ